jgi:hypothetical protein
VGTQDVNLLEMLPDIPKLLRFVLSKPPDRVQCTNLRVHRKDCEEIEGLGVESGILKGKARFDDDADASLEWNHEAVLVNFAAGAAHANHLLRVLLQGLRFSSQ